jgi:maltooligosyltrehalose trehalohydrolase
MNERQFGARVTADGTSFRLWAPAAKRVDVLLEKSYPLRRGEDGWFAADIAGVKAGARYKFRIDDEIDVPDPASAFQPEDVFGPSEVIDHSSYPWRATDWRGRPWQETVLIETHVGTFTPEGTYRAMIGKLDHLKASGITALELMPLADFAGSRNWGYDGVLWYAPDSAYGRPDDLKALIDEAHLRGLMVFLDVVYNHFGPEGNYLGLYAPPFFTDRRRTPWGQAINFDGPCSRQVRDFFIHNALYWLEEYHFDGLRFDAVHAIVDDSRPDILTELAEAVRTKFDAERHVHLVLENDNNAAHYLCRDAKARPSSYNAQWNDDIHHALHVLVTGEKDGYYSDYAQNPAWHLGRCLAEGFSYHGEESSFRNGAKRGQPSRDLAPTCFVSFLQNHDQVGNRALGERIAELADPEALKSAMAILLLAPSPPLLFMGEEFGATTPFLFFCDFGPELASKVTEGRRAEFARFEQFNSPQAQKQIPDPNSKETFLRSKLDWESLERESHSNWLEFYRNVLKCRRAKIVPLIKDIAPGRATFEILGPDALSVQWPFSKSGSLQLIANFGGTAFALRNRPHGELLYTTVEEHDPAWKEIPPLAAAWFLNA